jgi:membrane fusion protein, copper/silver efflux system
MAMKKGAYLVLLLLAIGAAFWAGLRANERRAVGAPAMVGDREVVSATPAAAPSASVHVHGTAPSQGGASAPIAAAPMRIGPDERQSLGLRVSVVEKRATTHPVRLLGRVAPDEARLYRLNAGIDGFIREVSAATTGSQVRKGETLATFFAPNSIQIIQQYIGVLAAVDHARKSAAEGSVEAQTAPLANINLQQRVAQLRNLGMSVLQMEEIARTRQVPDALTIVSPVDGFVLARNVSPDLKFDRGAEWYRIADLSRVWVLADILQDEGRFIRPGTRAHVSLPGKPVTLQAAVGEILPQFDAATRTLKLRLEVANPGFVLRPDMFVDVELPVTLPAAIVAPADAVIDSGLRKTVFVERGDGAFEARDVETGWRFGNRVEIVNGLAPGERIVTSGNFLLDSESRLRSGRASSAH